MRSVLRGLLALTLAAALCAPVDAGRRRRMAMNADPLAMDYQGYQIDWSQFDSPWGPAPTWEYGSFSPTGGPWEDMLKSGPTFATGLRWKYADFSGDLLPPSSTYFGAGYRYAFLKDEADVQLYSPDGVVSSVGNLRIDMAEFRATQRFIGPIRRGLFVDVGTALGMGAAHGHLYPTTPDPTKDALFIPERQERSFIIRGELNAGAGVQLDWVDFKFSFATGLSGASALTGDFKAQTDVSARIGGTIYLFD